MANRKSVKQAQEEQPIGPGYCWALLDDEWTIVEIVRENGALFAYPTGKPRMAIADVQEFGERVERA
jgi:hypothetical protein